MKKYGKSALKKILLVFGTFHHVDCRRMFWDGAELSVGNQALDGH